MRRKTNKRGILAIIGMVSALFASACGSSGEHYDPAQNAPETLYGPPFTSEEEYDPADNLNEDVYGPPEWFGEEPEDNTAPVEDESMKDISSNFSFREDTSGNTSAHDVSANLKQDISGGDSNFKPADNIAEPVYGPPAGDKSATE
ncbi:MAG: hypothetical protein IKR39_06410 [Lachnospiraceae bacterium]|nr:hypothetical protein [Lachnospiraceae bacterium]